MPFQTARDLFIFTVMLVAMGLVGLSNKNSQMVHSPNCLQKPGYFGLRTSLDSPRSRGG
ncbi:unnamed protein product [Ectocarpus sp. CCAP 1310/34]|nr:unnamed protein product [Ectocarpus sp. CCAP 1310/34]